ncbi:MULTISPECIES: beta-mannosidase [unclassified Dysgonomonas]|jgi:mannan endo-1,4-beta-mannosidase|uniref:glycoside hydrolase 5 family protein n=1 Tax=unclassified Dysgonomonas TaxID=2630389 RepID=UPI0025C10448|nr:MULTISPECIES: beta-mannosidase [unclassified Dysgonomonas]MDR2002013.1 beta-mannosidase [Prevotella sp.]HMM02780.1 beta-mannosidase [Dysgonomonas sp.]
MKKVLLLISLIFILYGCSQQKSGNTFVTITKEGQFFKNGKPYYYIGTNFWYGAILASEGEGGNRKRLIQELDSLSAAGIENLRILVGADGVNGIKSKVEPTLQTAPGIYNDTILAGLDYLLAEMGKRNMSAVLFLNNSWEWSGGYSQYLEWAGHGKAPIPAIDGWNTFSEYVKQYPKCDSCKTLFAKHVEFIVTRTNRYTNKRYIDDPAIMSWQIGNEPRAFAEENKVAFALWISDVARQLKRLDPNHLVSVGSEGYQGCEGDIQLWELIHSYNDIDYTTIHIWPYNWGWAKKDDLHGTLGYSKEQTGIYIQKHLDISARYKKPMVIEEFGYPRDNFQFDTGTPVNDRNEYYSYVFNLVKENYLKKGILAGANFWAWGGFAKQNKDHVFWEKGDDYMGDPAQEEQGLYSVFHSDNTVGIISEFNKEMQDKTN